jgi:hypothetical protein
MKKLPPASIIGFILTCLHHLHDLGHQGGDNAVGDFVYVLLTNNPYVVVHVHVDSRMNTQPAI